MVAQKTCGVPIPSNVQGQVGQGFEQPNLVEKSMSPPLAQGLELDNL